MARSASATSAEDRAKAQVINHLLATKRIRRGDVLATEFVFGSSGCRADLVIFSDRLVGIEVKSERDNLKRIPSQIDRYYEFCTDIFFAVAPKHAPSISVLGVDSPSIWVLLADGSVRELSDGEASGRAGNGNIEYLLNLKQKRKLDQIMLTSDRDRFLVALDILSERFVESSKNFWYHVGRRKVAARDIAMLSRFREERCVQALVEARQKQHWDDWHRAADRFFSVAG